MNATDELIWKLILRGISPEESAQLKRQVAENPDVALQLADAQVTDRLLRDFLPTPVVDDDALAALIAAEIDAEEKSEGSVPRPLSPLRLFLPWVAAAACLLIFGACCWISRSPDLSWAAPTVAMATYRGDGADLTPSQELIHKAALDLQKMISKAHRKAPAFPRISWGLHVEIKALFDGGIEVVVTAVSSSDPTRSVVWPSAHRSLEALRDALPQLAADVALRLVDEAGSSSP